MSRRRRVAIAMKMISASRKSTQIHSSVQRYARETGRWECVIDDYPQTNLSARRGETLAYDGIIGMATETMARSARRLGIPLVNVWFHSPVRNVPSVFPDFAAAGRLGAEHLLSRGFRRFSYLVPELDAQQQIESREFRRSVEEAGFHCEIVLYTPHVFDSRSWKAMHKSLTQWLDSLVLPSAAYIEHPVVAQIVASLCQQRKWSVPQDVAILCSGDMFHTCDDSVPTLTSMDYNYDRIGYETARLLDRLMQGRSAPREPILVAPRGVVQRASTDFFAVDNDLVAEALRFIAANLHRPIDVHDVVDAMEASSSTLERAFRRHLGMPMSVELMRLRLEKAKRMLTEPQRHTLARIAHETGFRDDGKLCRAFRREVGLTPGQYRKQVMGKRQ